MGKLISLDQISASVLPAKVLVLLSKYALAIHKHAGVVVKINSVDVFKYVHKTSKLTDNIEVRSIHRELLVEVNRHLLAGTMQTNMQRLKSTDRDRTDVNDDDGYKGKAYQR